jgi:lysozyme
MTKEEFIALAVAVAAALARRFEGLFLHPYLCPAGVPSIGYGATYYEDGTRVTLKDAPITKARAEALLLWMVRHVYLPAVLKLCPNVNSPERLAAIIDFAFNLGSNRLKTSTLRKRVNAGDWDGVPTELRKWIRGGGKVLRGLVLRCEARVRLI